MLTPRSLKINHYTYFKVIGLEVKSGIRTKNAGMGIFAEKFHPEKVLLVGTGEIPYDEFLKINPREMFLSGFRA